MTITIREILHDVPWTNASGREVEPEGRCVDDYFGCHLDAPHATREDALQVARASYVGADIDGVGLRLPND